MLIQLELQFQPRFSVIYPISYECALIDAEIALEFMPGSFRALLAMGEALYHTASFEYSLLYYYRYFISLKDKNSHYFELNLQISIEIITLLFLHLEPIESGRSTRYRTLALPKTEMQSLTAYVVVTQKLYLDQISM